MIVPQLPPIKPPFAASGAAACNKNKFIVVLLVVYLLQFLSTNLQINRQRGSSINPPRDASQCKNHRLMGKPSLAIRNYLSQSVGRSVVYPISRIRAMSSSARAPTVVSKSPVMAALMPMYIALRTTGRGSCIRPPLNRR